MTYTKFWPKLIRADVDGKQGKYVIPGLVMIETDLSSREKEFLLFYGSPLKQSQNM